MATPVATANGLTLPLVGICFDLTVLTTDGTTKNSFTLTGFNAGFVVNGALVLNVYTTSAGDSPATPQASYASVDKFTLAKDPSDPTQVLLDLYVKDTTTAGATIVQVLVY